MNAISVIKLLPESKEQIDNFSNQVMNDLNSGEVLALDVLLNIKGFEYVIKNIKDTLDELALNEASKYSEKSINYKSAELQIKESGVKYDYSNCNDLKFNSLQQNELNAIEKRKEREKFLIAIKEPINVIDEDSGEVYEICPPSKSSKTIVQVKIK